MRIKTKLWKHQEYTLERLFERSTLLLVAGCSTGKTLTAYAAMERLERQLNRPVKMLVITIKPAIYLAWGDDSKAHCEDIDVLCLHARQGTILERSAMMVKGCKAVSERNRSLAVIVNYEAAWKMPLEKCGFDLVVCDESHNIKSHNAKGISASIAMKTVRIPVRLAMTGTSWDDSPLDVYGQMRFVNAGVFGNWTDFYEKYVIYYRHPENYNVKITTGFKNQGDLAAMLKPWTVRIPRSVIKDKLAAERHIVRYVDLNPKTKQAYRQMQQDFTALIDGTEVTADNILVQTLRLHQITGGFFKPYDITLPVQRINGADEKLEVLMSLLQQEIAPDEPVLVFCRFTEDILKISEALKLAKISYSQLTGSVQEHEDWQAGNGGRVLLANIQAGNAGVKLTRAAYAILYSIGHSRTDYNQALARNNRPGVDINKDVVFYYLLARHTVDEDIYNGLTRKGGHATELERLIGSYKEAG